MKSFIEIRPHHFLCLPGYKGFSYNKEHVNNWDKISKLVKEYPNLKVKIVSGHDALCFKCPNNKNNEKTCNERELSILDEKVKQLLSLEENILYGYKDLNDKLRNLLNPKKHEHLCGSCQWRSVGLCKDTFAKKTAEHNKASYMSNVDSLQIKQLKDADSNENKSLLIRK